MFSHLLWLVLAAIAYAQSSTFSPLRPPAIPLAVKSPYLSTWLQAGSDGGNGGYLPGQWPTFWTGTITGWTGMIRVDNATYTWMGAPNTTAYVEQTDFSYTSTRSIFTMDAGGLVQMTVTFLSGVNPSDLLRSSLPFSYLNVDVKSLDGKSHSVQVYTDISAEWVSSSHDAVAQWSYGSVSDEQDSAPKAFAAASSAESTSQASTVYGTQTSFYPTLSTKPTFIPVHAVGQGYRPAVAADPTPTFSPLANQVALAAVPGVAYHRVWRQTQQQFTSPSEQADWGYWYWATANTSGLSAMSGEDVVVRDTFVKSGKLPNTEDTNYRQIDNAWPVFAFAIDLGDSGSDTKSALFQLSLHQQNCVQFEDDKDHTSILPCMWNNYFPSETAALKFFYDDYSNAASLATTFDEQVQNDAVAAGGQDYASMASLAVRQAFAGLEFAGTPTQPLAFQKEISSDGNTNTVDVIFPFHPLALYTNATILKWLLDPLFIQQEAGNWPFQYSVHDIGANFPNATGHNDGKAEEMPLEECGNMLIMTLAYAQRANDNAYLSQHYSILKQWSQYLVAEALIPAEQISTDDFAGAAVNQTNLAIKGIIGIQAMAQIANRTDNVEDGQNFTKIAHDYLEQWQTLGINSAANPPHTTFNYSNDDSFGLLYNLFADSELGLEFVPQSVYDMQSTFYLTKFDQYGVPLDSRGIQTKSDWMYWCAAIAGQETKDKFLSTIAKWANETPTNFPLGDLFLTTTGDYVNDHPFIARPVVGGFFSLLALNSAPKSGIYTPGMSAFACSRIGGCPQ